MVLSMAVHLQYFHRAATMSRAKSETLTFRTTPEIKELLRLAAEHERRSAASMLEILILNYAKEARLEPSRPRKAGPGS